MHPNSANPEQGGLVLHAPPPSCRTKNIHIREITRIYREITPLLDIDVLTIRRISDLMSELNMLGVISTRLVNRGRHGRTKEMWFDTNPDKIWEVIMEEQDDRLAQIDAELLVTMLR